MPTLTNADEDKMWAVTFSGGELGGNVEALEVPAAFNRLTGTNITTHVWTDGAESAADRKQSAEGSVQGNELTGTFTLTFRDHTTSPIDFNAADTVMKARLEALDNIGTVAVHRVGPSISKGFSWYITFLSMPGAYPVGSFPRVYNEPGLLTADYTNLNGAGSDVVIEQETVGSEMLTGAFALRFDNTTSSETASGIPVDASASELREFLDLDNAGTVSVTRQTLSDGYTWLVTFDGCKIVNGRDVCNHGNVQLLEALPVGVEHEANAS